jgi:hypothetical protein
MAIYNQEDAHTPRNTTYATWVCWPEEADQEEVVMTQKAAVFILRSRTGWLLRSVQSACLFPLIKPAAHATWAAGLWSTFCLPCINATLFRPSGSPHSAPPVACS